VKDIGVQIDDVLNADGAKLIGRTRVRRCKGARVHISVQSHEAEREAATGSDPGVDGDTEVFDDTDFYQQLLRDVIDARGAGAMGEDWMTAQKQRKARKNVDTKASKGRKLRCVHFSASCDAMSTSIMLIDKPDRRIRYDVHEKVQNFMVPVPLVGGGWHEAQIDELFASLLGKGFGDAQPVDQTMADDAAEGRDILKGFRLFG